MKQGTNPIHDPEGAAMLADTAAVLRELAPVDAPVFDGERFADVRIHRRVKTGIKEAREAGDLGPFREALEDCKRLASREFRGDGGGAA